MDSVNPTRRAGELVGPPCPLSPREAGISSLCVEATGCQLGSGAKHSGFTGGVWRQRSPLPHSGQNCRLCHFGMLAPQARQTITFVRMRTCQWPGPRSPRAARRGVRSLMRRGSGARLTGALAKSPAKTGRPSHYRGSAPLATRSRIRPCALSPAGRWRSGGGLLSQQRLGDCGTSVAGGVFRLAGLHDP
jgi:hypothetical protein